MAKFELARTLFTKHFSQQKWLSQLPSDWTGPFLLPEPLVDYYARVGPVNITLKGYGNPYFLPSLARLWGYQEGYRYNGKTGQVFEDWNDDWLVVADEGADPFILSRSTGEVSYAVHGVGYWKPDVLFDDLEEMVTCLLILGAVTSSAPIMDFTDEESLIKPGYYAGALNQLGDYFSSPGKAKNLLEKLGWVSG
jgi:hypothetical protein